MRPVRIANVSGFWGDRLSAPVEMLEGPDPVDVLTGDYLAELTMLLLWKARRKDPVAGFATTFLRQMEQVLGTCVERGVKVVANAGGLNPHGLAERLAALGTGASIAVVSGDDVVDRYDDVVTANAYLGGWGITAGLAAGADVVVTGRVTDAALVSGTAAWWHGWAVDDWDRLAGAVAAGHVIECGPQATGGNYALVEEEVPLLAAPGFPIAEVAEDGSAVITKQPGTGGVVSVGTVTAQLLYEIGSPTYLGPDVVASFDSLALAQEAPDRVRISGTVGSPPPATLKVACNRPGGWRNTMTMVVPGLEPDMKARRAMALLAPVLAGVEHDVRMTPAGDALHHLTVTVKSPERDLVDRRFSGAVTELALAGYAGFHTTTPPSAATEYGIYEPRYVDRTSVQHQVLLPSGETVVVPDPPSGVVEPPSRWINYARPEGPTRRVPLGTVCGARSGDKGGDANVGVWARTDEAFRWLASYLTVEELGALLPEAGEVVRYELPNLRALNFVLLGLLGEGVASSTRPDPQAKGLGEHLRSRLVDVPCAILDA